MTESMVQNAISSSVVGLTRHVMRKFGMPADEAYRLVYDSELFKLLSDPATRLFLETNEELCGYYDVERTVGKPALYAAIV